MVDQCNNVLFLRNPLDLLVSSYYSRAFSHSLPQHTASRIAFHERRNLSLQEGIDKYVIRQAKSWIIPHFSKYTQLKRRAKRCTVIKYDSFFYDFDVFCNEFVEALEMNLSPEVKEKLYKLAKKPFSDSAKNGSGENIYSHYRSGKSNQYLTRLKPETIDSLYELLHPILKEFDFCDND